MSLYCFSRDFTIALSMFATALHKGKGKKNAKSNQGIYHMFYTVEMELFIYMRGERHYRKRYLEC